MNSEQKIVAIAAVTLDGKIARHAGHMTDWTSPEDKEFLHDFLDKSDVVVVGNNTYKTAQEPLSKRNCIVLTHSVTDTKRQSEKLLFCNPASSDIRKLLENYRTVAILGGTQTYTYFLEKGLLDEIYITIEPLIFGNGLELFKSSADKMAQFYLRSAKRLNERGSILLHYEVLKASGADAGV